MPLPEFVNEFARTTRLICHVRPKENEDLQAAAMRVCGVRRSFGCDEIVAVNMDTDEAQVVKSIDLKFYKGTWDSLTRRFSWETTDTIGSLIAALDRDGQPELIRREHLLILLKDIESKRASGEIS